MGSIDNNIGNNTIYADAVSALNVKVDANLISADTLLADAANSAVNKTASLMVYLRLNSEVKFKVVEEKYPGSIQKSEFSTCSSMVDFLEFCTSKNISEFNLISPYTMAPFIVKLKKATKDIKNDTEKSSRKLNLVNALIKGIGTSAITGSIIKESVKTLFPVAKKEATDGNMSDIKKKIISMLENVPDLNLLVLVEEVLKEILNCDMKLATEIKVLLQNFLKEASMSPEDIDRNIFDLVKKSPIDTNTGLVDSKIWKVFFEASIAIVKLRDIDEVQKLGNRIECLAECFSDNVNMLLNEVAKKLKASVKNDADKSEIICDLKKLCDFDEDELESCRVNNVR